MSHKAYKSSSKGYLRIFGYTLVSVIIILVGLTGLVLYQQARVLTMPQRNQNIGTFAPFTYQEVTLTTADNLHISGWYVPGTRPDAIILVHGIHANRDYLRPQAIILAQAGYHLLLIDLRGHGFSEGDTLTYGYQEALDVQAAVDYLASLPGIEHIGAMGHSLGAAAAVRAAATDDRLAALVIQSSYSSLSRVVDESFDKFTGVPKWPFAPLLVVFAEAMTHMKVSQVNSARDLATMKARPVLIIHSVDDNLFQAHHAEEMYQMAQEPKELWLVAGVPHINPITGHEAEYQEVLLKFFDKAFN